MDGVVYLGSGNRIGDALSGIENLPALIIRGSRDPFCPKEVRYAPALEKMRARKC